MCALPSAVTGITVNVLPSGKGSTGNPVTELVPGGDVSLNRTVPSGAVIITMISTTLVFVLGTDTLTIIGVTSDGNEMMTEAFGEVKSTPDEPGLRSLG